MATRDSCPGPWQGVRVACVLAWLLVPAAAWSATSTNQAGYVRFLVSPRVTVYAGLTPSRLRLASRIEDLRSADGIRPARTPSSQVVTFSEVALPVLPADLPSGCAGVRVGFTLVTPSRSILFRTRHAPQAIVDIEVDRRDGKGTVWTYRYRLSSSTGDTPESAPVVPVPKAADLELSVVAKRSGSSSLGVALRLMDGRCAVSEVLRHGRPVDAYIEVFAENRDKPVAIVRKPISQLGFG